MSFFDLIIPRFGVKEIDDLWHLLAMTRLLYNADDPTRRRAEQLLEEADALRRNRHLLTQEDLEEWGRAAHDCWYSDLE